MSLVEMPYDTACKPVSYYLYTSAPLQHVSQYSMLANTDVLGSHLTALQHYHIDWGEDM